MRYTVLIPARLASSRLPNKPLADIAGVPMVVRVAQRVSAGVPIGTRVVVAADSVEIMAACADFGVQAVLTHQSHPSGSDRLAQACEILGLDEGATVVNVQGDEPLIDPGLVQSVAAVLQSSPNAAMGTAACAITSLEDYCSPHVVKVVLDASGHALYFSRAPIPHWRDKPLGGTHTLPQPAPLRHIGIYAYRVGFLRQFPSLAQAPLEITEALEQLRALWHGHKIAVHLSARVPAVGVDTPQDLERVRQIFAQNGSS